MQPNDSFYHVDWLRIAEKDWQRAQRLLDDGDPELAGFCLQQAVEKFLKAFLLSRGWQLRRIHNLEALLDDAVVYIPSLDSYREVCQKITAFYMVERYPSVIASGITEEDVRSSLSEIRELIEKFRELIG
ncbi:MAG: HEPN domain-containing protein [Firmicutes bacterium]|nr:HEPN domain-containing protein [Bacillota bacterium]